MKSNFSVGTDIVEVSRVGKLIQNRRFVNKIFSLEEIRYCSGKKLAAQHYAVRFAAKEAVWKALSHPWKNKAVAHKEISVYRADSGKPIVHLSPRLKKFESHLSVSLSHTHEHAIAVALYCP